MEHSVQPNGATSGDHLARPQGRKRREGFARCALESRHSRRHHLRVAEAVSGVGLDRAGAAVPGIVGGRATAIQEGGTHDPGIGSWHLLSSQSSGFNVNLSLNGLHFSA